MALDLPKPWPPCPGCSQPVNSAKPLGYSGWMALPCGCPAAYPLVVKVMAVSGARA